MACTGQLNFLVSSFSSQALQLVVDPGSNIFLLHSRRSPAIVCLFFISVYLSPLQLNFSIFKWLSSFPCSFHCSSCNLFWYFYILHSFSMTIPSWLEGLCKFYLVLPLFMILFVRIRQHFSSFMGPYIFLTIFLSNILRVVVSSMVIFQVADP